MWSMVNAVNNFSCQLAKMCTKLSFVLVKQTMAIMQAQLQMGNSLGN